MTYLWDKKPLGHIASTMEHCCLAKFSRISSIYCPGVCIDLMLSISILRSKCGHCQIMDREDESVCCQEITEILSLNEEAMTIEKIKVPLKCA